jgi:hypothetical protein
VTPYAANTDIAPARSREDIERLLTRKGATSFAYGWHGTRAILSFVIKGRRIEYTLPMPDRNDAAFRLTPTRKWERTDAEWERIYNQAVKSRWRALLLVIKAKLEAIEAGITTLDDEFMSNIVLPGGATIGEYVRPKIQEAIESGQVPELLPSGSE